jgi:hypothetical protein
MSLLLEVASSKPLTRPSGAHGLGVFVAPKLEVMQLWLATNNSEFGPSFKVSTRMLGTTYHDNVRVRCLRKSRYVLLEREAREV